MSQHNEKGSPLSLPQFFLLLAVITVVNGLLWFWLVVPADAGSPALAAMSVWGFALVAGLASVAIAAIGMAIAEKSRTLGD